jgi:hypothetical protein
MVFVWGMRLVLVSDAKGVPRNYDLVNPKTGRERECAFELTQAHHGAALLFDGGLGVEYERTMELIDIELVIPDKHKLGERPESELVKARIRLVSSPSSPASRASCASRITSPRPSAG